MATHLVDCPACACLIEPAESACPFCGAAQRRIMMPAALTLGLVLGLAAVSCNDKAEPTTMSSTTMTTTAATGTTAATDSDTVVTTNDSDTLGPVAAYAGPSATDTVFTSPTEVTTGAATDTDATDTDATETDATETDATDTVDSDFSTGINSVSAYAGAPGSVDPLDPPEDLVGR